MVNYSVKKNNKKRGGKKSRKAYSKKKIVGGLPSFKQLDGSCQSYVAARVITRICKNLGILAFHPTVDDDIEYKRIVEAPFWEFAEKITEDMDPKERMLFLYEAREKISANLNSLADASKEIIVKELDYYRKLLVFSFLRARFLWHIEKYLYWGTIANKESEVQSPVNSSYSYLNIFTEFGLDYVREGVIGFDLSQYYNDKNFKIPELEKYKSVDIENENLKVLIEQIDPDNPQNPTHSDEVGTDFDKKDFLTFYNECNVLYNYSDVINPVDIYNNIDLNDNINLKYFNTWIDSQKEFHEIIKEIRSKLKNRTIKMMSHTTIESLPQNYSHKDHNSFSDKIYTMSLLNVKGIYGHLVIVNKIQKVNDYFKVTVKDSNAQVTYNIMLKNGSKGGVAFIKTLDSSDHYGNGYECIFYEYIIEQEKNDEVKEELQTYTYSELPEFKQYTITINGDIIKNYFNEIVSKYNENSTTHDGKKVKSDIDYYTEIYNDSDTVTINYAKNIQSGKPTNVLINDANIINIAIKMKKNKNSNSVGYSITNIYIYPYYLLQYENLEKHDNGQYDPKKIREKIYDAYGKFDNDIYKLNLTIEEKDQRNYFVFNTIEKEGNVINNVNQINEALVSMPEITIAFEYNGITFKPESSVITINGNSFDDAKQFIDQYTKTKVDSITDNCTVIMKREELYNGTNMYGGKRRRSRKNKQQKKRITVKKRKTIQSKKGKN